MTSVRFSGESPWDAVVNHNSLNIEEEGAFRQYVEDTYAEGVNLPLEVLERLYTEWRKAHD